MYLFDKNLKLLRTHDWCLARRVEKVFLPENVVVVKAGSGDPIPQVQSVFLHSSYQPVIEARKQVKEFSEEPGFQTFVHGLGFGYHIHELLKSNTGEITVVEPLMTVFRAFLENIDLSPYLPRVRFLIAETPQKILGRYAGGNQKTFIHRPSVHISRSYFQALKQCAMTEKYLDSHRLKVMVVNPIYGGSLPTAQFCAQALKRMGHEVATVQCNDFADSFSAIKKVTKIKQNENVLAKLFMNMMDEVILAKAAEFKPDLVLALAQAPLSKAGIARLKALEIPIAFWFVEDFRTLTYWKDVAGAYDYFFTIQQDEFFNELESRGIKNYYYLPQACSPAEHKPIPLKNKEVGSFFTDLSFMGAAYYNRLNSFPRLLGYDFKIWGTGWDLSSPLGQRVQNQEVRVSTEDCVKIYNGAKINLNLHSSTFHEDINPNGDFVNPRTFEIAACGGFQLVDDRLELHDCFRVGEEIITFNSMDDLKNKIDYFLKNGSQREAVSKKSRERVLKEHTFEHRLKEMLIHIFYCSLEKLQEKVNARVEGVEDIIERVGASTDLGNYLKRFRESKDFSLKKVIEPIEQGEGDLTKMEFLLLMVDQIAWEEDKDGK